MVKDRNYYSVYGILEDAATKYGNKEALFDLKSRFTFSQIKSDADRFAAALTRRGFKKGDRIAVSMPNWYEIVVIYFAAAKIGATLVPFNPKYKAHEVNHILRNSEPRAAIVSEEFERNIGIKEALFLVPEIFTVRFHWGELPSYQDLMNEEITETAEAEIDVNNDIFCILYTSGTTGVPKGVMIPHRSVVQSANVMGEELYWSENDVLILPSPLFHIFGMAVNLFCAIFAGTRIVLLEKFNPQEILQLIEQEKVTILNGVPTMFIKLLEADIARYDISSLRTGVVGASPIPASKVKEIRDRLGINLCQSFGITETVSVTLTPYDDCEKNITETLGKPLPGVVLRIVDEGRQTLPSGETGEIAIQSFGTMKGYYKLPEQTSAVIDHMGWYFSGDLGILDDQGNLKFIGRKKELIIRGGFNIYPQEIEAVLAKHPKIVDSAVIGLPDETLGEIVCAVVQLKNGELSTEEEIKTYLKEQIAIYKVPGKVIFTDKFPVTASGKIMKLKLREEIGNRVSKTIQN
ncbi:class I adenylate-forming enzyme family protein [Neobacillus cucumis]|uniref:class I adenylate-forming enzyme family protein n=1 Tax=Neobacillus cucumis TaxID=1740721 RepID=UPI0028534488|nr:class I adenylate-forming enzyme family protein [Neobacillus cucumis]MDR4946788.1 class I adenylate-forming enzyme family protein [Neobacillus cucumis]